MISIIIFYFSGAVIVLLLLAKVLESKREKPFLFLSVISKGDIHFRKLSHNVTNNYYELKEKTIFFIEKQLPLRYKSFINKIKAFINKYTEKYLGDFRNTHYINSKNESISEFFKSISHLDNTSEAPVVPLEPITEEPAPQINVLDIPEIEVVEKMEVKPKRVVRRRKKI